jgi:hypothetical protein
VGTARVAVRREVSTIGWERSASWAAAKETVGVQGTGWKGVGVGDAFGAGVTKTKGSAGWVGAVFPHPASPALSMIEARRLARKTTWGCLFIRYWGVAGVFVTIVFVGWGVNDAVGDGGTGEDVTMNVEVAVGGREVMDGVVVQVGVKNTAVRVGVTAGMRVGTFGTHSL